jgi:transglutaminase-like putative cysteine protease
MRLEIRYMNEFLYSEPAWESHNLLRACPADNDHQQLVSYRVDVFPQTRIHSYIDFWGTRVDEFGILEPHQALRIEAESVVENQTAPDPVDNPPLQDLAPLSGELSSYLRRSPHAAWDDSIHETARDAIARSGGVVDAVTSICDAVTASLKYESGATYVGVQVAEVLSQGKGVCQDFAHLGIAMYRSVGIPARYVSGYLYAADQTVAVVPEDPELDIQTHAWLEVFIPGHGWWALDPTNPQPVGELHVKIGHGRDYEDVMPLRGVYHGGAEHDLGVHVQITRERLTQSPDQ